MLTATPAEGYAGLLRAPSRRWTSSPTCRRITAPTLVIAGLADEATPPAHARRIADADPGARLALVAGAAHLANVRRPELVDPAARRFPRVDDR